MAFARAAYGCYLNFRWAAWALDGQHFRTFGGS
jgi:hypothetical protein